MKRSKSISTLYKKISSADGSEFIASEYAISKIHELIKVFGCKNVLEVGLGIGSISEIILSLHRNKDEMHYHGTEANDFCLTALPNNLKSENFQRLKIFNNIKELPVARKYDLIIVDGRDDNLNLLKERIAKNGIIAIEGDRMPQQQTLQELFPKSIFYHNISNVKNSEYSPFSTTTWQAGLKIIFVNPTGKQKFWWIKGKILTKLKYFYRGLYKTSN